ncbi:MAG: FkbM family methyltransferase [Gemmatimonadota bacterium]|nr:FkbM family methyltransferase [Gemmatimonadota bacterium]
MYLDPVDSLLLSMRGIYEPAETALVQQLVGPGSTVLDIGANIGYYTLQFAELVGASGRVIAFEPDPANFELLARNTQLNGYLNVTLVQRAASNTAGILNLHRSITNWGDSRIFDSHDGRSTVEIASLRLDDHLARP